MLSMMMFLANCSTTKQQNQNEFNDEIYNQKNQQYQEIQEDLEDNRDLEIQE